MTITIRSSPAASYTLACSECGQLWIPANARGQAAPTDSSLERAVRDHFATCDKTKSAS